MDLYGHRYIPVSQFIDYCRDYNVRTRRDELDHYERECLMLPVARTVEPLDYSRERNLRRLGGGVPEPPSVPPEWAALEDNIEFADHGSRFPEPAHDHPFDREVGRNLCLIRPDCTNYHPLVTYKVEVVHGDHRLTFSRDETYYSYWQIHQLILLQQLPDLFANLPLLNAIPDDHPVKKWRTNKDSVEPFRTFRGRAKHYDSLSSWISRRSRLYRIAMGRAQDFGAYKRLESADAARLDQELAAYAFELAAQGFDATAAFDFIRSVLELARGYDRSERSKLAETAKDDARMCAEFLYYLDGLQWADIGERVEGKYGVVVRDSFLHLDPVYRSKDDALRNLIYIEENFAKAFSVLLVAAEPEEITSFCLDHGIFEVLDALRDFSFSPAATRRSAYGFYFRRMRLLALALEQFARELADKGGHPPGPITLTPLLRGLAEQDPKLALPAKQAWSRHSLRVSSPADCLSKLAVLQTDTALQGVLESQIRNLLIACLARNAAAHTAPPDWNDVVDRMEMGDMIEAIAFSFVQVWQIAKRLGWV